MAEGRRERVRERLRNTSIEALAPHEIVELLLYQFMQRKDAVPLARALIEEFDGEPAEIFRASEQALLRIKGMPKAAAFYFAHYNGCFAKINQDEKLRKKYMRNLEEASEFFSLTMGNLPAEEVRLICLDAKSRILCSKIICEGSPNSAVLDIRALVQIVLDHNATFVFLAHNHPSGSTDISQEDWSATRQVYNILRPLQVELFDHILIAGGHCVSLRTNPGWQKFVDPGK